MYCLSLYNPWATAIISGLKSIEVRTWRTHYRGDILIHAGRKWDNAGEKVFAAFSDTLRTARQQMGGIIGIVEVYGMVRPIGRQMWEKFRLAHRNPEAWWGQKSWWWLLRNPRPVKFIPRRGQQGLWIVDIQV